MSTTLESPPQIDAPKIKTRSRSRVAVTVVLAASLVVTGLLQNVAQTRHDTITGKRHDQVSAGTSTLSGMDSFALALLLGGLRGPLVMILWTSSETAKQERDLEGVNTQIEWIRLLQPEFDTVHVFQIWNKAYNLSVQMANLSNKYTTILDALDYAHSVLAERPNNITITSSIASIFFDKIGNSSEKIYYKQRVRDETRQHPSRQRLSRNDPAWTRLELDPMLDDQGNILPNLLKPTREKPAEPTTNNEWNDGSELQYLAPYQPFPQGLSPFALGYNYYKQAEVMQTVEGQRHIQSSDVVVDSRPPLALKNWSEDEWERGRRFELRAFNVNVPAGADRSELEMPTSKQALGSAMNDPKAIDEALYAYDLSARLCKDAIAEYERHLKTYTGANEQTYLSHIAGLRGEQFLCLGDAAYLRALRLPAGAERDAQIKLARDNYAQCLIQYSLIIIKYYTDDDLLRAVLPKGYFKTDTATEKRIENLPPETYPAIVARVMALIRSRPANMGDPYGEDRDEYLRYMQRATDRMSNL